ncbi:MAG TPA: site-2 protease family protein [Desulfobacteraceae bacterium]|nr:site-2 protease family protein [Desulfobacteraceae bacterium]
MNLDISTWIIKIPVLLFSITLHEYAHGRSALFFGDPTAKMKGRLTLNPLPHIDPFGALCLFLFNFGWAKPVPVDPRYFRNPRRDIVFMSLAGPAANLMLAALAGLTLRFFMFPSEIYQLTLFYLLFMNVGLGLFNLLPLPPLDGSHILENLLPLKASIKYREIGRYGPFLLIGIIMLDNFAHTGILSRVLIGPMRFLAGFFSGIPF